MSYYDDKIWIFGGISTMGRTNFLSYYDTKERRWFTVNVDSTKPPPRSGHTMVLYQDKFWIYGGEGPFRGDYCTNKDPTNREIYGDVYSYDIKNNAYIYHVPVGTPPDNLLPTERRNHSSVSIYFIFILYNSIWK